MSERLDEDVLETQNLTGPQWRALSGGWLKTQHIRAYAHRGLHNYEEISWFGFESKSDEEIWGPFDPEFLNRKFLNRKIECSRRCGEEDIQ